MRYLIILLFFFCSCASQSKMSQKEYEREKKGFKRRQAIICIVVTSFLVITYINFTVDDKE